MAPIFPILAFLGTWLSTRQSLGAGVSFTLGVGYLNGVIRANYLSVWTTFQFDAAILGLYLGFFTRPESSGIWRTPLGNWIALLMVWPTFLALIPVNDLVVQLVALRATIWYLPVALLALRLTAKDLDTIARTFAGLNLISLSAGYYIFVNGLESLYPENSITELMYRSKDVAGGNYRIPSTFMNAHQYGGTMGVSLAFLLGRLLQDRIAVWEFVYLSLGVGASLGGVLMCAARMPVAVAALTLFSAWILSGFSLRLGIILGALAIVGVYVSMSDERLQRFESLDDADAVENRLRGSANDEFLKLLISYPLGAGIGSAVGTNIPFFLSDRAPEPIGLENEYSRITVDQGWLGLILWLAFLRWMILRKPIVLGPWRLGTLIMLSCTGITWATAFLGTGTLSSIPGSMIVILQIGVVAKSRVR